MHLAYDRDRLEEQQSLAQRIYNELDGEMIAFAAMDLGQQHGMRARRLILGDCRQVLDQKAIRELKGLLREKAFAVVRPNEGQTFPGDIAVQDYHDSHGYWHIDITDGAYLNDLYIGHECYIFHRAAFGSSNEYMGLNVDQICRRLFFERGLKSDTMSVFERLVRLVRQELAQSSSDDILKNARLDLKKSVLAVGPPAHAAIEALRYEYLNRYRGDSVLL